MRIHLKFCSILLLSFVFLSSATLAPPDKHNKQNKHKKSNQKEIKVNRGPVDKNVFERNLVQDEPTSESILKESGTYYKNTSARLFDGPTLGFVTPVRRFILTFPSEQINE